MLCSQCSSILGAGWVWVSLPPFCHMTLGKTLSLFLSPVSKTRGLHRVILNRVRNSLTLRILAPSGQLESLHLIHCCTSCCPPGALAHWRRQNRSEGVSLVYHQLPNNSPIGAPTVTMGGRTERARETVTTVLALALYLILQSCLQPPCRLGRHG